MLFWHEDEDEVEVEVEVRFAVKLTRAFSCFLVLEGTEHG